MIWILQELEVMKKRLKEMEDEAAALREMQAKVEREMGTRSLRFCPPTFQFICVLTRTSKSTSVVEEMICLF